LLPRPTHAVSWDRARAIAAVARPVNPDVSLLFGRLYVSARRWVWAERFGTTDEIGSVRDVDGGAKFVVTMIVRCGQ